MPYSDAKLDKYLEFLKLDVHRKEPLSLDGPAYRGLYKAAGTEYKAAGAAST
jgi:hypothetical protein